MIFFREKRKSVGQLPVHFYPIEDNEDLLWDVKTPSKAPGISDAMSRIEGNQTESEPKRAPMLSAKSRSVSLYIAKIQKKVFSTFAYKFNCKKSAKNQFSNSCFN